VTEVGLEVESGNAQREKGREREREEERQLEEFKAMEEDSGDMAIMT
jgi:hypothetical protein